MQKKEQWHLDKKVPIALILAIALQAIAVGIWVGTLNGQVNNLAAQVAKHENNNSRIVRLETLVDTVRQTLEKIDRKLDKIAR